MTSPKFLLTFLEGFQQQITETCRQLGKDPGTSGILFEMNIKTKHRVMCFVDSAGSSQSHELPGSESALVCRR